MSTQFHDSLKGLIDMGICLAILSNVFVAQQEAAVESAYDGRIIWEDVFQPLPSQTRPGQNIRELRPLHSVRFELFSRILPVHEPLTFETCMKVLRLPLRGVTVTQRRFRKDFVANQTPLCSTLHSSN